MKIQDLLVSTARRLEAHSETPQLDTQVLLAHITKKNRAWVMAHPEYELDETQVEADLKRLEAKEPLPYVLGKWEFFGLEFDITNDVLIPRPETEMLVEKAIAWLKAPIHSSTRLRVADVGTGSGAIAVSIAKHTPDIRILATDISPAALRVAKSNAEKFQVQNQIELMECDLFPPAKIEGRASDLRFLTFDLICSNPPYIPTNTLRRLPIFGHEPTLALDGGMDGLNIYRRLFQLASHWLAPKGMMLLEIESTLGRQILDLTHASLPAAKTQLHQDLTGRDRLLQVNFI